MNNITNSKASVFPISGAKIPSEYCHHRFFHIPCLKENAVYVEGWPLHASKIQGIKRKYVAAQAPLQENKSLFWKAIFDGDYTIFDLTTEKDRHKGVSPYYPETFNEDYRLKFHTIRLIAEVGLWKKYSVQEHATREIKEINRLHFADWPEYKVISLDILVKLINSMIMSENIWVFCRDGVQRTCVVVGAALLEEKISNMEVLAENFEKSVEMVVDEVQSQRLKSFPHEEHKELLFQYGESLLKIKRKTLSVIPKPVLIINEIKKIDFYNMDVNALWDYLNYATPKCGNYFGETEVFYEDALPHRFSNIPCIKSTALYVDEEPIHANHVILKGSRYRFVAAQAPLEKDEEKFCQAIFANLYTIFDLTNEPECSFFPDKVNGVHFINKTFHVKRTSFKDKHWKHYDLWDTSLQKYIGVKRYHHPVKIMTKKKLSRVVNALEATMKDNFWIQCYDGVGQTGTFIVACILKEKIFKREIHIGNLKEELIKLILEVRERRAYAVSTIEQLDLLLQYGMTFV